MTRGVITALLIIAMAAVIFEFQTGLARGAETASMGNLGQVLQNQRLILEKLNVIENKIDVLKIRATKN